jgi:hypothetical protein
VVGAVIEQVFDAHHSLGTFRNPASRAKASSSAADSATESRIRTHPGPNFRSLRAHRVVRQLTSGSVDPADASGRRRDCLGIAAKPCSDSYGIRSERRHMRVFGWDRGASPSRCY